MLIVTTMPLLTASDQVLCYKPLWNCSACLASFSKLYLVVA
jgi:hypothetical protein